MPENLKNKLLANMCGQAEINEYMKYLQDRQIREKLFDNSRTQALKARKKARRPVNGGR